MEHLTHDELRGYGSGAAASRTLIEADRHLAECARCRYELRRVVAAPALPGLVLEMQEPVHLSYEEMTGYIDATVSGAERERMEEHAAICRSCAKELKELQAFDARMAAELNAAPAAVQAGERESWLTRMMAGWTELLAAPRRLRLAGAGVALMLFGVFSVLQFQVPGADDAERRGSHRLAHVAVISAATHPNVFYGGFVIAAAGVIALLYGLRKK